MPSTSSAGSGGGVGVKDGKEGPSASNVVSVGEANSSQQHKVLLSKTNSGHDPHHTDQRALSGAVRTHRRQISYPVTFKAGPPCSAAEAADSAVATAGATSSGGGKGC